MAQVVAITTDSKFLNSHHIFKFNDFQEKRHLVKFKNLAGD